MKALEAKDLRVGNLLHDRENNLCIVIEINTVDFKAYAINGPKTCLPNKPIELTEEWLVRCGFEKESEKSEWFTKIFFGFIFSIQLTNNGVNGYYLLTSENSENFSNYKNPIIFLHQLQNFHFAIVGEELTINQS